MRRLLLVAVALSACSPPPAPLEWSIGLAPGLDGSGLRTIVAEIREGSCDESGRVRYRELFTEMPVDAPAAPPSLAPGRYALAALGIDDGCEVFVIGCTAVELPREGAPVAVVLRGTTRYAYCADCVDGRCGAVPDASVPPIDAGPRDAGERDAGPRDAALTPDAFVPPDAFVAPDAGPCGGSGERCCAGDDCDGSLACEGGTCRVPEPCSAATCDACRAEDGCGFCLDTGQCLEGRDRGPSSTMCTEWVFEATICACLPHGDTSCTDDAQCCGPLGSCRQRMGAGARFCCNETGTGRPCSGDAECCGYTRCLGGTCRCVTVGQTCADDIDCCDGPCVAGVCEFA